MGVFACVACAGVAALGLVACSSDAGGLPSGTGDWYNVSLLNEPGSQTYPIVTFTYLMVYQDLGKAYGGSLTQVQAQELVSFLWWITHTGQNDSAGLFYVPLPASVVAVDVTGIGDIMYNGAPLKSH